MAAPVPSGRGGDADLWLINSSARVFFTPQIPITKHQLCEEDAHFGFLIRCKGRIFVLGGHRGPGVRMLSSPLCGPLSPCPSLSVTHPLALSGAERLTKGHGRGHCAQERGEGQLSCLGGLIPRDSCSEPGCALGINPPSLIKSYNNPMTRAL